MNFVLKPGDTITQISEIPNGCEIHAVNPTGRIIQRITGSNLFFLNEGNTTFYNFSGEVISDVEYLTEGYLIWTSSGLYLKLWVNSTTDSSADSVMYQSKS